MRITATTQNYLLIDNEATILKYILSEQKKQSDAKSRIEKFYIAHLLISSFFYDSPTDKKKSNYRSMTHMLRIVNVRHGTVEKWQ